MPLFSKFCLQQFPVAQSHSQAKDKNQADYAVKGVQGTSSRLTLCEDFYDFKYDKALSYITDKITPEGVYYGDRNPTRIGRYLFDYNKDKIGDIEFQFCSNADISVTTIKAKKKVTDFFKQAGIL